MKRRLWGRRTRVDGLPGDQHRHDRGLAGAGRHLEGEARQVRVGLVVGVGQMVEEAPAGARARRHLGQPDGGLGRFHLAEEGADAAEVVVPPVPEQAGGLRGHLPLGLRQLPPAVDLLADPPDDFRQVVLLAVGPELLRLFVEYEGLLPRPLALSGFGIGVMNSALRRLSMILWVGCPVSSSSQCRDGRS